MANTALNRTGSAIATNKSGGSVAKGDVVIIDLSTASSFTTTTTGAYVNGIVGVVMEPNGITSNAQGIVAYSGWVPQINLSGSASIGDFVKTHTVAKQGVRHAAPAVTGDFAIVFGTGTSPAGWLFGVPVQGGGGGTDTNAVHVSTGSEISGITAKTVPVDADLLVIEDSAASNAKKSLKIGNLIYPKQINVPCLFPLATNGTIAGPALDTSQIGAGRLILSNDITAWVEYPVLLQTGTWKLDCVSDKGSSRGIGTFTLDGVSIGTADAYAVGSSANFMISITGISVTATKVFTLRVASLSKNASSSGYNFILSLLSMTRTA